MEPKNLTRREGILLKHLRAGKTISDAAYQVRFSKNWPGQAGFKRFKNIQKKMPKIPNELGSTYKAILKELKTQTTYKNKQIDLETFTSRLGRNLTGSGETLSVQVKLIRYRLPHVSAKSVNQESGKLGIEVIDRRNCLLSFGCRSCQPADRQYSNSG